MMPESKKSEGKLTPNEVRRLIASRCDDRIGPDELRQLEEELATSPESRSLYIRYLDLHASLGWEVTARQHVDELARDAVFHGDVEAVEQLAREKLPVATVPRSALR